MIAVALFFLRCHFADGFGQPRYMDRENATALAIAEGPMLWPTMERLRDTHPDAEVQLRAEMVLAFMNCFHCGGATACPVPGQRLADCPVCLSEAKERGVFGIYRGRCGPCNGTGRRIRP